MKNYFFKPAAALALLLTILLGACDNPVSPRPQAAISEGKGLVRVETGAAAARTAVPAVSFARYEYWFAKDGGAPAQETPAVGVFELEAGSYTVTVKAFVAAVDTVPATEGSSDAFTITAGADAGLVTVVLRPVIGAGAGTLSFALAFPEAAAVTAFALTRVGGEESYDLLAAGTAGTGTLAGTLSDISAGYWLARASLEKGGVYVGKSEVAHVYDGLTTELSWTFGAENFAAIPVVSAADSGPGTLREALTRANAGLGGKVFIDLPAGGNTITLAAPLPALTVSLTIEGNGATLTQSGITPGADTQLLYISDSSAIVTIRRLHFTGGKASGTGGNGGAILSAGELILESCVFSHNSGRYGGAVAVSGGNAAIQGSTFYSNSATRGGAIYRGDGTLSLTGNLFFGNAASGAGAVAYGTAGITSAGYNVSDKASGIITGASAANRLTASGYDFAVGDLENVALPISPANFKPMTGGNALGRLPSSLPGGYPAADFYGEPVAANGAAGAVQAEAVPGYWLDYGVTAAAANLADAGRVELTGSPNEDGLYAAGATVSLRAIAEEGWRFVSWTIDSADGGSDNPLSLELNAHKTVRAVFVRDTTVYDEAGLRAALDQQVDGDVIRFGADIVLAAVLPHITTSIVIEGDGHTLTRTFAADVVSQLLRINGLAAATVSIRRLHFKDGATSGYGGAIWNEKDLTLESCIFSSNEGGAIYVMSGNLTVKACTFYNNRGTSYGGAISRYGGTVSLTGNLFFGNAATSGATVAYGSNITSDGYNVSDKGNGVIVSDSDPHISAASGYAFAAGDLGDVVALPISPVNFKPITGGAALGRLPYPLPAGYPALDFYGAAISADGASGAAQTPVAAGYYLDNGAASGEGELILNPPPNADGLYTSGSNVTLTAAPAANYVFHSWTIDGAPGGSDNPLSLELNAHKTVRAKFKPLLTVSDETGLRAALDWLEDGDVINFGADITLTAPLPQIAKSITIEGNGHTIFAGSSGPTSLLRIRSSSTATTIRRLHFKDGLVGQMGAAIQNNGDLVLESCIFSGNESKVSGGTIYSGGNASLTVKSCTFYNNRVTTSSGGSGAAIYCNETTLELTGNLFYGNTAAEAGNVVFLNRTQGTGAVSFGYNVSDKGDGIIENASAANAQTASGYAFATGDVGNVALPISPANFKPITGGAAFGRLPSPLPAGYPAADFYGAPIVAGGASGAVQTPAAPGYYLDYGVATGDGAVNPNPAPDADGMYAANAAITLTAEPKPGYVFRSWTIDGAPGGDANPLSLQMDSSKTVRALFGHEFTVNDEAALIAALGQQADGDLISFGADITLTDPLPQIAKSIAIEGNGHTLTRSQTWTISTTSHLLWNAATTTVRGLRFEDGLAAGYGGAIRNTGNLTLESCIFSGNEAGTYGGAIFNSAGSLTVRGCTFHNNRVTATTTYGLGAAIYRNGGTVVLTGNLFSGNTAGNGAPVAYGSSVSSSGYNVSDMAAGVIISAGATNKQTVSGYANAIGDLFSVTDIAFDGAFKPSSAASLKTLTTLPADFPATYFDGSPRSVPATAGAVSQ